MTQVAKYTIGIAFDLRKQEWQKLDSQLRQLEKKIALLQTRLKASFSKAFDIPPLTVKKLSFNSPALRRGAQAELNRVGRLLELRVGKIRIDPKKTSQKLQQATSPVRNSLINAINKPGITGNATSLLPAAKVKKFDIDELSLQRNSQAALNRVGRLLELKIGNIRLDQSKINGQVQNVFQRAANSARMNVKTIAGTSGGANPYPVHGYAPQPQGGGFNPHFIGMPRIGGGGLLAGGIAAGGFMAASQVNEARRLISKRELERLQLEIAVGGSKERRQSSADVLIDLSNRLGIAAESQVDGYTKFMKQGQLSMKLKAQEAFDLYANMAIATRGNGGDQQSIERQAYALQQIGGLGYLRAEELNLQLADSAPSIRSYIIAAWEERTGMKGVDKFLKAMEKRQVSFDDVMRGYEASAKDASGKVKELANSIQGEEARFANLKFAEELERSKGPMTAAARQLAQSQQELYQAMEPLRDSFYRLGAASTSLTARFISASAKQLSQSSAFKGQLTNEQRSEAPMASSMGRGLLSVPDIRQIKEPKRYPLNVPSPLSMENQTKDWQLQANQYMRPADVFKAPGSVSANVTVSPGAITITAHGMNEQALADTLQREMRKVFDSSLTSALQGVQAEQASLE